MKWIINRLKETSTWKGLVWLLTACGIALDSSQIDTIITAGLSLAALLEVFTKEKK